MTTEISVPYTFTPGTKAKASEVNANFSALSESLNNFISSVTTQISENVTELNGKISQKTDPYLTGTVRMSNGILEAPNGVASYATNVITVFKDLKILIADGRNSDKTLKNETVTLEQNSTLTLTSQTGNYYLLVDENSNVTCKPKFTVGYAYNAPLASREFLYYDEASNYWMYSNDGSAYTAFKGVIIGEFKCSSGVISSFTPYRVINLTKHSDVIQYLKSRLPNYEAGISYDVTTLATTHYVPCDGVLILNLVSNLNERPVFYINDISIGETYRNSAYGHRLTGMYHLSEGDYFRMTSSADPIYSLAAFYPLKGAYIC